jgi:hypothetical protein
LEIIIETEILLSLGTVKRVVQNKNLLGTTAGNLTPAVSGGNKYR